MKNFIQDSLKEIKSLEMSFSQFRSIGFSRPSRSQEGGGREGREGWKSPVRPSVRRLRLSPSEHTLLPVRPPADRAKTEIRMEKRNHYFLMGPSVRGSCTILLSNLFPFRPCSLFSSGGPTGRLSRNPFEEERQDGREEVGQKERMREREKERERRISLARRGGRNEEDGAREDGRPRAVCLLLNSC